MKNGWDGDFHINWNEERLSHQTNIHNDGFAFLLSLFIYTFRASPLPPPESSAFSSECRLYENGIRHENSLVINQTEWKFIHVIISTVFLLMLSLSSARCLVFLALCRERGFILPPHSTPKTSLKYEMNSQKNKNVCYAEASGCEEKRRKVHVDVNEV